MNEFEKERKEHPKFTDVQIRQIVQGHRKLEAMGLDEQAHTRRYRVQERARVNMIAINSRQSVSVFTAHELSNLFVIRDLRDCVGETLVFNLVMTTRKHAD